MHSVAAVRFSSGRAADEQCLVAAEQVVTFMVEDVGNFTIMCTPTELKALAVGFAFTEGLIEGVDDVLAIAQSSASPDVVGLKLENPPPGKDGRNLIVSSSCGICGGRNVEKLLKPLPAGKDQLSISSAGLIELLQEMQRRQHLFTETGGAHAAAIFTPDGEIAAFAEDIGRHNALDKAIGLGLLNHAPLAGCGVMLSGRVSFELIAKAARAGLELVAGASAPTSLAIEAAERTRITLCAFVRENRATAFTHPHRIKDGEEG